jgi:inosine-uridine nucleoside N-ribohydrolase
VPRRVIFDTDPGVDDTMALFFLLRCPEFAVEAVTTVFGNTDVEQTTRNALIALDVAGRPNLPVARGAAGPLMRERQRGGEIVHGNNGMGGAALPTPSRGAGSWRAADLIADRVMAWPGEITLIAVGPLTNLALATRLEPGIVENVRQVVVMGGAATVPGNESPLAEANFYNDPEAAQIVLTAGFPLTLVGLDVTLQAVITPPEIDVLRENGGREGAFIGTIIAEYRDRSTTRRGRYGVPMHDSAAVLYALDPAYFETAHWYVEVETHSPRAAGQVMVDRRGKWAQAPNADVCLEIDADRFLSLYQERLTALR